MAKVNPKARPDLPTPVHSGRGTQQGPTAEGPHCWWKRRSLSNAALLAHPQGAFPGEAAALRGVQAHLLPPVPDLPWEPSQGYGWSDPQEGTHSQEQKPLPVVPYRAGQQRFG